MKAAFTLAEVLITLVIIGVIAAITVPVLSNSYTDKMYISALKKNFSVLSNAFNLSQKYDYFEYIDWNCADSSTDAIYADYQILKKYLNIIRECKDTEGCWSNDITQNPRGENAASASTKGIGGNIITFTLNDGTNVCLDYWSKGDIESLFGVSQNLSPNALSIFVDVNGDKKPNRLGRDVFAFVLTTEGLVPAGANNESEHCDTTGYDCSAKYIMKY